MLLKHFKNEYDRLLIIDFSFFAKLRRLKLIVTHSPHTSFYKIVFKYIYYSELCAKYCWLLSKNISKKFNLII